MKVPINPSPKPECRKRPSRRLIEWILENQKGQCLSCGAALIAVEFDHIIPLGLGGENTPDNWAALCPGCHKTKTRADVKRIAKAKRQRRFHETGRSRARTLRSPIGGVGRLDHKSIGYKKCMNGMVVRRCDCPECRDNA